MGHPVAPAPLGPIEPLVRPGQHGAKILSRPDQGGAQAHGHRGGIRRHGRHCGADPLRHLQQYPLVYLRQQDQKLLATAAHEEILPPQLGRDALADPALVKKLTDAFLKLDPANPEHKEIMALQRASKFIPTKKENYDGIEKAAQSAGLLK